MWGEEGASKGSGGGWLRLTYDCRNLKKKKEKKEKKGCFTLRTKVFKALIPLAKLDAMNAYFNPHEFSKNGM